MHRLDARRLALGQGLVETLLDRGHRDPLDFTGRTVLVPSSDPRVAAALWRSGIATTTATAMPHISVQPAPAIAAPIVPPPLPPMPTHEPIEIADAIEIETPHDEDDQVIVLPSGQDEWNEHDNAMLRRFTANGQG